MKKEPLRRCCATGERLPKKELLRVVRTQEGTVEVDLSGRKNGRGAYIKRSMEALEKARKTHALSRALEAAVPEEVYERLQEEIGRNGN